MSKPGSIEQHRDAIVAMRAEGKTARQISDALGINIISLNHYVFRAKLPPKRPTRRLASVPVGRMHIAQVLTPDEFAELDRLAVKWGCETLAEAVMEIAKDALAEMQEAAE